MLSQLFSNPISFLFVAIGLVIAITVHEFAHAFAADKLGDPTPKLQGRLTLNPLSHLDLVGSLMILFTGFGWGKPVQFDPFNLDNPRRDTAIISLAGPISNILTAAVFAILIKLALVTFGVTGSLIAQFISAPIIIINITLALFNMIPIHPLDGGKILIGFLPKDIAYEWDAVLNRYGVFILILLIFPIFGSSPITHFIQPVRNTLINFFLP